MSKKGILLVNLGTPDSPSVEDVQRYLDEFLMDGRVIDMHQALRSILVKLIIVPFRGRKSAKLYGEIWNVESGSPLMHYSKMQQHLLKLALGNDYQVELAMRYQNPSIALALEKLKRASSIKVIPMFPQYASATTGSVFQKVMEIVSKWPTVPNLEFVNSFHDHPRFIKAFANRGKKHRPETFDHIVFSFHGLPQMHCLKSDPTKRHCLKTTDCCRVMNDKNKFCYGAQSYHTARLIACQLNIPESHYTVCFQSRLGNTPWMQPYASEVITQLAAEGKKRVLVFCPSFVTDCLETVYEVGVEYRELFIVAGGEHLELVEGLNQSPLFIETLEQLATAEAILPY